MRYLSLGIIINYLLITQLVSTPQNYTELKSFEEFQKISGEPESAIIEVYAPWCSACKSMEQTFETIAQKYAQSIHFYKIDGDAAANKTIISKFDIQGFPTILTKINSKPIEKQVGALSEIDFERHVQKALNLSSPLPTEKSTTTKDKKSPVKKHPRKHSPKKCKKSKDKDDSASIKD